MPSGRFDFLDVGGEQVVRLVQTVEPEGADLGEHAPLVGNAGGQHPVEGADAVGADQQQFVAQVVDIAHFAAADGQVLPGSFAGRIGSWVLLDFASCGVGRRPPEQAASEYNTARRAGESSHGEGCRGTGVG